MKAKNEEGLKEGRIRRVRDGINMEKEGWREYGGAHRQWSLTVHTGMASLQCSYHHNA